MNPLRPSPAIYRHEISLASPGLDIDAIRLELFPQLANENVDDLLIRRIIDAIREKGQHEGLAARQSGAQ
jgi:hypothetical protein